MTAEDRQTEFWVAAQWQEESGRASAHHMGRPFELRASHAIAAEYSWNNDFFWSVPVAGRVGQCKCAGPCRWIHTRPRASFGAKNIHLANSGGSSRLKVADRVPRLRTASRARVAFSDSGAV